MSPISANLMRCTEEYLRGLTTIDWLRHAGTASDAASTVDSLAAGFDSDKSVWLRHTHMIEEAALARIGESAVDWVFEVTSDAVQDPLYAGVVAYFERRKAADPTYDDSNVDAGLTVEMMDCIKRDLAWSAVEAALQRPGFFTALLAHYRAGRWPCSWSGQYPEGSVVLL